MNKSAMLLGGAVTVILMVPATEIHAVSAPTLKVSTVYTKASKVTGTTTKGAKLTIKRSGKTLKTLIVNKNSFSVNVNSLKAGQKLAVSAQYKNKTRSVTTVVKASPTPVLTLTSKKLNGSYLVLAGKTDKNAEVTVKNGTQVVGKQTTKNPGYTIKIAKNKLKSSNFTLTVKNLTSYGTKTRTEKLNYKAPTFTGITSKIVSKLSSGKSFDPKSGVVAKDSLGHVLVFKTSGSVNLGVDGKYTLTYTATDAQGFQTISKRVITVHNIAPTLKGTQATTVNKSAKTFNPYTNVTAQDALGTTLPFTVSGTVNMNKSGSYTLTYATKDAAGYTTSIKRVVTVKNDIAPTITGISDVTIKKSLEMFRMFDAMSGVTATDSDGNKLEVNVAGYVDMTKSGVNTLTYIIDAGPGNVIVKTRKVTVKNGIAPTITGISDVTIKKSVGTFDAKSGVTATDSDGNKLVVNVAGNVDMTKSGIYTLTYSTKDADGYVTTKTRKVTVKNDIAPTFTGVKDLVIPVGDPENLVESSTMNVSAKDSDGKIVNFSKSGTVDINKVGTYALTYTGTDKDGNTTTITQKITVMIPDATGIKITGPQIIKVGTSVNFSAVLTPTGAKGGNVTWTSSNNSIATIDANGKVSGVASGTALISATITDQKGKVWTANYSVTVNDSIDASLFAYSQFTINNYSRQVAVSLTSTDSRVLRVTRVQVNDGSFWSADYSEEQLKTAGILTTLNSGDELAMTASSRVGWDLTNLNVIVTVQLPNGQTKNLTVRVN